MDKTEAERILAALKSGTPLVGRHKSAEALKWSIAELAAANEARDALRAEVERLREALRKEAHIIFDGPPGPTGPHFVEVEDGSGRSIRCGEWRRDRACYWSLVISGNDIAAIDAARKE